MILATPAFLLTTTTTLLLPFLISARNSFFGSSSSGDQKLLKDTYPVPGENPLLFCQDPSTYSLTITNVDLVPNPPSPGKVLTIKAKGNFTSKVVDGAYLNLSVKYGLIGLIHQKEDLCEQMKNVDEECPLDGFKTVTKEVKLPDRIPPGKYTVLADVYTKDEEKVTCLEAVVHF